MFMLYPAKLNKSCQRQTWPALTNLLFPSCIEKILEIVQIPSPEVKSMLKEVRKIAMQARSSELDTSI